MGGIQGMFLAQYEVLRENGHTPSEAFNETVEEATQSLFPLIGKYGMDYMYNVSLLSSSSSLPSPRLPADLASGPSFTLIVPSLRFASD
jgi:ketol-acid reductoisomerase